MITSTSNPRIRWIRRLQSSTRKRRKERVFVVEGVRLAEEALSSGWETSLVIYSDELDGRGLTVVDRLAERGTEVFKVTPQVMGFAADTETPQGILAVLRIHPTPVPERLSCVFIPDAIRDPGNLGTMLRTAVAAGVEAVFLPPGAVDPFAPKVVRAGMGAHFRIPIVEMGWEKLRGYFHDSHLRVVLAAAGAGLPYHQMDFDQPIALIVGGEAEGASMEARNLVDEWVHIPMAGGAESLNAAVAASILLFEVLRQRTMIRKK